jgi:putative membrane protein
MWKEERRLGTMIAHWHGFWFFPLFWIVLVVFLFGGRWFWWRRYRDMEHGLGSGERVLAERFARGEIDESEYRRRLAVLKERR